MGNKKSKPSEPKIDVSDACESDHPKLPIFDEIPHFRQRASLDWSSNPLLNPSAGDPKS